MPRYDLGAVSDFAENEPTKASTACRDLVVVRRGEAFYVLDHACQHLGAPLSDGIVEGDGIVCPWHRAVIALEDGELLEPPGCRHHRRYEALVEDGRLSVEVASDEPSYRPARFAPPRSGAGDPASVLILGAGAAGMTAAQTLAEEGFGGEITILSDEADITFDRTKLSKKLIHDMGEIELGALEALRAERLRFVSERIESVSLDEKTVSLASGEIIGAEAFILATGSAPRRLDLPGAGLPGIVSVRDPQSAERLAALADEAKRVVILGAGFIGMEVAAVLSREDLEVTIVAREEVPFGAILGKRMGTRLQREQEEAGVHFRTGETAARFEGEDRVERVVLESGESLDADMVVVAAGAVPRTGLFPLAEKEEDGGLPVDEELRLGSFDGVYAAGDIASAPTAFGRLRSEHWRWAQQMGRWAALSCLGSRKAGAGLVPFFWTKQQAPGSYVYLGHTEGFDDILYEGEPDDGPFVAYYLKDGRCRAILGLGMADTISRLERRMAQGGPLEREELGV